MEKQKIFTVPNILSLLRIAIIPFFFIFYLNESLYYDNFPLWAILIYLFGFFLDVLDGMIARKFNSVSKIGKVLDPLADKLFRLSIICAFWIKDVLPLYVFIILLVIDLVSIIVSAYLYVKKITVSANWLGKLTTVYVSIALFSCFFHNLIYPVNLILVLSSLVLIAISMTVYAVKYIKMYKNIKL